LCYLAQVGELMRVATWLRLSGDPGQAAVADRLHAKAEAILADGLPAPCWGCVDTDDPARRARILDAIETAAMLDIGVRPGVELATLALAQSPADPDVQ
jgi:hypothetical protein